MKKPIKIVICAVAYVVCILFTMRAVRGLTDLWAFRGEMDIRAGSYHAWADFLNCLMLIIGFCVVGTIVLFQGFDGKKDMRVKIALPSAAAVVFILNESEIFGTNMNVFLLSVVILSGIAFITVNTIKRRRGKKRIV
jgi:hypothetical protein